MADFKYKNHMDRCEQPCPSEKYEEREMVAYRWVHQPFLTDDWNPVALIGRGGQAQPTSRKCGGYALSFFKSKKSARRRLVKMNQRFDVETLYGTHAAEVQLRKTDGVSSKPTAKTKGHFDLHEYAIDQNWAGRVESLHPMLPKD